MTVKELITELEKEPQELPVKIWANHGQEYFSPDVGEVLRTTDNLSKYMLEGVLCEEDYDAEGQPEDAQKFLVIYGG